MDALEFVANLFEEATSVHVALFDQSYLVRFFARRVVIVVVAMRRGRFGPDRQGGERPGRRRLYCGKSVDRGNGRGPRWVGCELRLDPAGLFDLALRDPAGVPTPRFDR